MKEKWWFYTEAPRGFSTESACNAAKRYQPGRHSWLADTEHQVMQFFSGTAKEALSAPVRCIFWTGPELYDSTLKSQGKSWAWSPVKSCMKYKTNRQRVNRELCSYLMTSCRLVCMGGGGERPFYTGERSLLLINWLFVLVFRSTHHIRSVNPLCWCMVGEELFNMERMHSK